MKLAILTLLALGTLSCTLQADVLYRFDVNGVDGVAPFSFSLVSPAFVESGAALSFAPFAVTKPPNSWTMVQGRAPQACFEFGTVHASIVNCGFVLPSASSEGGFNLNILGGALPNAAGVYYFDGEGTFLSDGDITFVILSGSVTVSDIAPAPEPRSLALCCIGAGLVAVRLRKRTRLTGI